MSTVRVEAPCKVNLELRVLGRRADGFHELDTVLLALDRCDLLTLALSDPAPGGAPLALRVEGPLATEDVPAGPGNLVWRAAAAVLELAPEPRGQLSIVLEKHVPSRAGLGGGSADAAACALGTARLLGLDPDDERIARRLAALGSDCLFFHAARATGLARCTGRGERVRPLGPPPHGHVAVITPDVTCSTAEVYAALARSRARAGGPPPSLGPTAHGAAGDFFAGRDLVALRPELRNDLEAPALDSHPALRAWARLLEEEAPHFRLAGSGSSWFGLFPDGPSARAALRRLARAAAERELDLRCAFAVPVRGAGSRVAEVPGGPGAG